jgi:hypothetical protein
MLKLKLKEILKSLNIRRQTFRKMNDKFKAFRKVSYGTYEIEEKDFLNIQQYYALKKNRSWPCRSFVSSKES